MRTELADKGKEQKTLSEEMNKLKTSVNDKDMENEQMKGMVQTMKEETQSKDNMMREKEEYIRSLKEEYSLKKQNIAMDVVNVKKELQDKIEMIQLLKSD